MKTYGLPYKGSKDKICEKICSLFPIKENFYDLFMGGGSITHYQLLQNQYKNYYANDFNPLVVKAFSMAIHGKFKDETRWISHEEFNLLKDSDPYVAFCFSFGTDLKQYTYGEETEYYKKALHYLIVFQDATLINKIYPNVDFSFIEKVENINERRLKLQQFMKRNCDVFQNNPSLNRLETIERLQSFLNLSSCKNIKQLSLYNKSYDEIEIKSNSVIYVDPPYKNVSGYKMSENFNHEKFYDWCERQTELCFISEYSMPKDRFTCIAEIEHRSIICANENQSVTERVFLPNHQAKDYKIPSLFDM